MGADNCCNKLARKSDNVGLQVKLLDAGVKSQFKITPTPIPRPTPTPKPIETPKKSSKPIHSMFENDCELSDSISDTSNRAPIPHVHLNKLSIN